MSCTVAGKRHKEAYIRKLEVLVKSITPDGRVMPPRAERASCCRARRAATASCAAVIRRFVTSIIATLSSNTPEDGHPGFSHSLCLRTPSGFLAARMYLSQPKHIPSALLCTICLRIDMHFSSWLPNLPAGGQETWRNVAAGSCMCTSILLLKNRGGSAQRICGSTKSTGR